MGRKFSKEFEEAIISDYNNNVSLEEIAKKYDINPDTVRAIRKRHNVPARKHIRSVKYNHDLGKDVVNDYKNGIVVTDISVKYKISIYTVYNILKENNITFNRKTNITKEQEQEVVQMYLDGCDVREIMKKYNISNPTVYNVLNRNKVPKRLNMPKKKTIDENTANNIINDYLNSDLGLEEIYLKYNINGLDLKLLLVKNNISDNRTKRKQYTDNDIITDYNSNIIIKDICAKYNICRSTVYGILKRNNIKTNRNNV